MSSNSKHNEQYQKNEKRILNGYLSELKRGGADGKRISLKDIAVASGLSYRTVLGHYKNFSELERSNIEATVEILCNVTDMFRNSDDEIDTFLQKLLIEVSSNHVRFEIECFRGSVIVWQQILLYARDILTQGWITYGKERDVLIFHRFCAEFIGVIYLWSKTDFSKVTMGKHLWTLKKLTRHAINRELYI